MSFATLQPALPFIKSGKLTVLATLGASRAHALPNIATLREQGMHDFEVRNCTGLLAPAGTPSAITHRLAVEVDKVMQSAAVQNMLAAQRLIYTAWTRKLSTNSSVLKARNGPRLFARPISKSTEASAEIFGPERALAVRNCHSTAPP